MAECADCHHVWTGTHPETPCQSCGLKLGDYWFEPDPPEENEPCHPSCE